MGLYDDINLASKLVESKKKNKHKLIIKEQGDINKYINDLRLSGSTLVYDPTFDISLSLIENGITDITVVDDNPLAKYYSYLKQAGLITFSYQQFVEFFFVASWIKRVPFDKLNYDRLKWNLYELSSKSSSFWNVMYEKYGHNIIKEFYHSSKEYNYLRYKLFRKDNIQNVDNLPYLKDEDSYELLKENMKRVNITYISANIFKHNYDKTFNNIVVSSELDTKKSKRLSKYLNKDGVLVFYSDNDLKDSYKEIEDNDKKIYVYKK